MAYNFFKKILKENIKVSGEMLSLLSEVAKEFPLKTFFNVSLILLATFSEAIGIGLLIPFLEILLNNDLNNISVFSAKIHCGEQLVNRPGVFHVSCFIGKRGFCMVHNMSQLEYHTKNHTGNVVHDKESKKHLPPCDINKN